MYVILPGYQDILNILLAVYTEAKLIYKRYPDTHVNHNLI